MTATLTSRGITVPAAPTGASRLLSAPGPSRAEHLATHGPLPDIAKTSLVTELEASGLGGRGGAAFPTWRKLTAIDPRSDRPVVIANGAEGEPLSVKDATLLTRAPHLVLDGLMTLARTLDAAEVHLASGPRQLASVRAAIAERTDAREVRLHETADTFISGEASALVNSLRGGRAVPTDRTVRLTDAGLRGRPTLVQNVETLAHVALVARWGAEWFRTVGTADEPGTRLLSITAEHGTRVVEAAGGIPIRRALEVAGIDPDRVAATLVGGYHGAWVPGDRLDTALSRTALAPFGASPGAGILLAIPPEECPLDTAARIATYLASQSARQCGPCLNGLPRMAETLTDLATGRADGYTETEIHRLSALVAGRGSCHHPDGTARFVLSTLQAFSAEVADHLGGRCGRRIHP
ncbi:NADH-ubiquinone oxidoreductase-F iron-sulfur binding region domain-containing protein [Microbacterium aquimaris]|uniref:NADH-ubiquinone oxidoreductase-F iron-sulfur binding region domain-containing protein n=1 Tax=Microbacterium aquimaris TaxID=459816 RepID=A0ABU5N7Q8_9MICO|nr:NADH-ubiquinone oxidoreductase-F iron-sulfur binding region domain-containing protein [Microbacterium aquimaris]MDZ8161982.1 NADH-ubiquinone oxidoreductase-F iron-sulfur binding region domain-containing protein [Microbacterium aquimaris]